MPNRLALFAGSVLTLVCTGCGSPATEYQRSGTPTITFEVRRCSREPVDEWETVEDPTTKGSLFLSPQTELTNDDVASTGVRTDEYGIWQVMLQMDDAGTEKVAKLSAELVESKQLLAFLVDGEVLCTPVTYATITDGVIPMTSATGDFNEEDARRIAKGIVGK